MPRLLRDPNNNTVVNKGVLIVLYCTVALYFLLSADHTM